MLPKNYRNLKDYYTKKRTKRTKYKITAGSIDIPPDKGINGFMNFFIEKGFVAKYNCFTDKIANISIPGVFSFTENPVETIKILKKLVRVGVDKRIRTVNIDFSNCVELELSASLMIDVILWQINKIRQLQHIKLKIIGSLPSEEHIQVRYLLAASGVLKHLKLFHKVKVKDIIRTLDFFEYSMNKGNNVEHDKVGKVVADYFNNCYNTCGFEITEAGINKISKLASEIVLNCDNHCGDNPRRWFCQGHFHVTNNVTDQGRLGECQLSIVSIGNTFFESIENYGTEFIKERIENQYNKVVPSWRKFWNKISEGPKKELFYLLYCLQENISRYKDITEDIDRGKGTVTLFQEFQYLGRTKDGKKPKLSITSGQSSILFDGTYKLQKDYRGLHIIAFNENNDLNDEPDYNYVKSLNDSFPGVVINLKFYIDEKFLQEMKRAN